MRVYLDTSVIIALTDSSDMFHEQSVSFVNRLVTYRVDRLSASPLIIEIGKLAETKETKRCLDIINAMEEFGIQLKSIDMKQVWKLSESYVLENVLTKRHRLDLLHCLCVIAWVHTCCIMGQ